MKFYFLIQSYALGLYKDIYDIKNVYFYNTITQLNNPIKNFMGIIIGAINKIFHIKLCIPGLSYKNIDYNNSVVVIESGFLKRMDKNILIKLSHMDSVRLNLLLLDSMRADSPDLISVKDIISTIKWKNVFTVDQTDAQEHGWTYIGLNYYSSNRNKKTHKKYLDAYFIGGLKGERENLIISSYDKLSASDCKVNYDLFCYNSNQHKENRKGLIYHRFWLPYKIILHKTLSSNCVIEILQKNQHFQSLRYFEAVTNNMKLLTNNKNIFTLPFYDERYMKYFSSADDIDIDWIKKKENIDYGYKGEFSPVKLFELIKKSNQ